MRSWLAAIALVVVCAIPAHAANEANHLGTSRGSTPVVNTATGAANNGATTVITAVTGKRIAVIGVTLTNSHTAAGIVTLKCGASGTSMWQARVSVDTVNNYVRDSAETGGFLFRCAAGTLVELNNATGGNAVQYNLRYVLED